MRDHPLISETRPPSRGGGGGGGDSSACVSYQDSLLDATPPPPPPPPPAMLHDVVMHVAWLVLRLVVLMLSDPCWTQVVASTIEGLVQYGHAIASVKRTPEKVCCSSHLPPDACCGHGFLACFRNAACSPTHCFFCPVLQVFALLDMQEHLCSMQVALAPQITAQRIAAFGCHLCLPHM